MRILDQFFWFGAPPSSYRGRVFEEEMKKIRKDKGRDEEKKKPEHLEPFVINGEAGTFPRLDLR